MARYHGQKALYEVMHKTGLKPAGPVEPVRPAIVSDPQQEATGPAVDDPGPEQMPPSPAVRWRQPRWIQFNAGRVELTIPYPIAVAGVLALLLIVLLAYRLGQR